MPNQRASQVLVMIQILRLEELIDALYNNEDAIASNARPVTVLVGRRLALSRIRHTGGSREVPGEPRWGF